MRILYITQFKSDFLYANQNDGGCAESSDFVLSKIIEQKQRTNMDFGQFNHNFDTIDIIFKNSKIQ